MKRVLSLILTVAMLASMVVIGASAVDGNNALYVDNVASLTSAEGSMFTKNYIYISEPYTGRATTNPDYGFNVTYQFDVKVTDYQVGNHMTSLMFAPFYGVYNFEYSFDDQAFVVRECSTPYCLADKNQGYNDVLKVNFPFELNTWYEYTVKLLGKTAAFYINGIELFNFDLRDVWPTGWSGHDIPYEMWDWEVQNPSSNAWEDVTVDGISIHGARKDPFFIHPCGVSAYFDNVKVYTGDYDIATDSATHQWANISFTDASNGNDDGTLYGILHVGNYVNYTIAPNAGIDGVQYDRAAAAAHVHDLTKHQNIPVTCTTAGYDLYPCDCGVSLISNYQKPLGHAAGFVVDTYQAATDDEMGITKRLCYATDRYSCNEEYMSADQNTGSNKGLKLVPNETTSIINGYIDTDAQTEVMTDGTTVVMDILPTSFLDKDFAKIGAGIGFPGHYPYVGYVKALGKFVIADLDNADIANSVIYDEYDADVEMYKWTEWAFKRDHSTISLYLDGVEVLSYTFAEEDFYADPANRVAGDYIFLFNSLATNYYVDNVIVAESQYDVATDTGIVYETVDFNNVTLKDGFYNSECAHFYAYDAGAKAGFQLGNYSHAMDAVTNVHQDEALYLDTDYTYPMYGYAQMPGKLIDTMKSGLGMNPPVLDFSYQFDFCVDDYCTDAELLGTNEAYIGGHINGYGNYGAFAGYDLTNRQFVIGEITNQVGHIEEEYATAAYDLANGTWHNMKLHYYLNEDLQDVVSIYFDGTKVLTYTFEDIPLDYQYYIFFPTYCDMWLDNFTMTLDGTTYADAIDFTNAYSVYMDENGKGGVPGLAMFSSNSSFWSLKNGGVPTHVYEEVITPAGCTEDGYTTYTCSCGESTYVSYNQPATGHVWDAGVIDPEPTYDAEGVKTYTCTVCGETKTETVPKLVPEFIYGDVDGNGEINNTDINTLKRKIAGYTVTVGLGADVDGNGTVNNTDINTLQRYIAGYAVTLGPKA